MAEKINRRIAIDSDENSKVARSYTDKPPVHFTLKVDSFSLLKFLKPVVTNDGDEEKNAQGYITLYLEIVDTHDLPEDWEVVANLKFFVYDHFKNKYLTIQDANAKASRFDVKNTAVGFVRVLPDSGFWYAGNGYLVNDNCVFGAEVLVQNYIGTGCTVESLAMAQDFYTWKIGKFSSLTQEYILSDLFTIGNQNWKLKLYPKGNGSGKNHTLSVFLVPQDFELFPERKIFAKFEFCTVNQRSVKDMQTRCLGCCFSKAAPSWGDSAFTPLADLEDASKGFLINDTLFIRAHVDVLSSVRSFNSMRTQTEATKNPQAKVKQDGSTKTQLRKLLLSLLKMVLVMMIGWKFTVAIKNMRW